MALKTFRTRFCGGNVIILATAAGRVISHVISCHQSGPLGGCTRSFLSWPLGGICINSLYFSKQTHFMLVPWLRREEREERGANVVKKWEGQGQQPCQATSPSVSCVLGAIPHGWIHCAYHCPTASSPKPPRGTRFYCCCCFNVYLFCLFTYFLFGCVGSWLQQVRSVVAACGIGFPNWGFPVPPVLGVWTLSHGPERKSLDRLIVTKLKFTEIEWLVQGHAGIKWQS